MTPDETRADRVKSARFRPVMLRTGYDMAEVDAFLDLLARALRGGVPIDELLSTRRFSKVRRRAGYDIADVDEFLEALRTEDPPAPTGPEPSGLPAASPDTGRADRIENARFRPVRLREGYDMGEVDAFLDELARAFRGGLPTDDLFSETRFTKVRLREGYDMDDVDAFIATLRSGAAALPAPPAPEPDSRIAPRPADGVIVRQRSLLDRLLGRR